MRIADDPLPLMIELRPGCDVIRQGDPYPGAWTVWSGALLMEAVDPEGRRFALDVLGRGDLVGGLPGWTAEASFRALLTSRLVAAGPAELRDGLARRAQRLAWTGCSLAWDRLADRVAARLDDLAARFGQPVPGGAVLRFPLRQEDLAGLTGATRESVNRALVHLASLGRVGRESGRYVIRPAACDVADELSPPTAASPASRSCSSGPGP